MGRSTVTALLFQEVSKYASKNKSCPMTREDQGSVATEWLQERLIRTNLFIDESVPKSLGEDTIFVNWFVIFLKITLFLVE